MLEPIAADVELPAALRQGIEAELEAGERLCWVVQPLAGPLARARVPAALLVLVSIASMFVSIWLPRARGLMEGRPMPAGVFVIAGVFVAIGLPFLVSPVWAYRKALRTAYVITDRRAMRVVDWPPGKVRIQSCRFEDIDRVLCVENADGSGNLGAARLTGRTVGTGRFERPVLSVKLHCPCMPRVREAEAILRAHVDPPAADERDGQKAS